MRHLFLISALLFLTGCATSLIPKEVLRQAPSAGFQQVLANPEAYKGKKILWGAKILHLSNPGAHGTSLVLLEIPVDDSGKPEDADRSEGRFIAITPDYLDREVYERGRSVTIAGEVQGKEIRPLAPGEADYAYPVIAISEIYLWPKTPPRAVYGWPVWAGSYWDYEDYGPAVTGGIGLTHTSSPARE